MDLCLPATWSRRRWPAAASAHHEPWRPDDPDALPRPAPRQMRPRPPCATARTLPPSGARPLDAERLARLRQVTVGEAAEQYKAAALSGGTLHHEREASHLALAIADMNVADTPLPDLERGDVYRLLDKHVGHPGVARHRFGALSRCLDWHVERGALSVNPCSLVGRKYRPKRPPPRQRVYSAAEMQTLWDAAEKLGDTDRDYLRLMLLMPLRRNECSELTPANLDKGRNALVLHGAMTKNRDASTLPLSPEALSIVNRRITELGPAPRAGCSSSIPPVARCADGAISLTGSKRQAGLRISSGTTCGARS